MVVGSSKVTGPFTMYAECVPVHGFAARMYNDFRFVAIAATRPLANTSQASSPNVTRSPLAVNAGTETREARAELYATFSNGLDRSTISDDDRLRGNQGCKGGEPVSLT